MRCEKSVCKRPLVTEDYRRLRKTLVDSLRDVDLYKTLIWK